MTLRYLFLSLCSIVLTGIAFCFSWWFAKRVDEHGYLPEGWMRNLFQPPDSLCYGDWAFHQNKGKNLSWYERSVVWLRRNGAQGFDLRVAGTDPWVLNELAMVKVEGDITITAGMEVAIDGKTRIAGRTGWFKVSIGEYWHYRNIKHIGFGIYTSSEFGWRLQGIAEGRPQDICRQLVFTPVRMIKFVK